MRTALIILAIHLIVGTLLWLVAMLDMNPLSFYSAISFFVWNVLGVCTLKILGLSPTLDALGFAVGGLVTLAASELVLGTALLAVVRFRRALGA